MISAKNARAKLESEDSLFVKVQLDKISKEIEKALKKNKDFIQIEGERISEHAITKLKELEYEVLVEDMTDPRDVFETWSYKISW